MGPSAGAKIPETTLAQQDERFRQLYKSPIDFKRLAQQDDAFASVVKGRELDFSDPMAVKQLTKTLLKLDFNLDIELPDDRLCPPVPNRHNYILWLKDLLDTSSYEKPGRKLIGLDIGTGASCIYPLLGCTQRPWSFIATDIDKESSSWAKKNVQRNELSHRIQVLQRDPTAPMIPMDALELKHIDFTMTNPPFYTSKEEMEQVGAKKNLPPSTACTGAPVEMVTEGGEVAFVDRILDESLELKEKVHWYTAMFGFLSSVTALVDKLHEHNIDNYAVTEFVQGNKTRRWAVGWSFGAMRPSQATARGTKAALSKGMLPVMAEFELIGLAIPSSISKFVSGLETAVSSLELESWDWDKQAMSGIGRATDKVWTRAWRRRKKREAEGKAEIKDEHEPEGFGFKIWIVVGLREVFVYARWLEGHDAFAFESFRGFLKDAAKSSHAETK